MRNETRNLDKQFRNVCVWVNNLPGSPNAGSIFVNWVIGAHLIGAVLFLKRDA